MNSKWDVCKPVPKLVVFGPKICNIFRVAKTEATRCSDVISCARRYGRKKKIVLVALTQSWLWVYRCTVFPWKRVWVGSGQDLCKDTGCLRHRYCVPCILHQNVFLRLDLVGHDSKGDTVRRRLIEGAVPTNANNSTTKSQILKSPFRGGGSSKEVLAVGNNGAGKISCCFFGDILKFFWISQSLSCFFDEHKCFGHLMASLDPRLLCHVFPDIGPTFTQ